MSRVRAPILVGTAVVAGAGYYLYKSGGNAKAAEQQFQGKQAPTRLFRILADHAGDLKSARDSAAATGRQAQSEAERYGAQVGAKADEAVRNDGEKGMTKEKKKRADKTVVQGDPGVQPGVGGRAQCGRGGVAEEQAYVKGQEARFNKGVEDTQARVTQGVNDAQARLDKGRADAQARINQGVDAFDKKVDETAAKTKSNVSGWFGGK